MATRLCADCGRTKTIRGVWYLTPGRVGASTPFVCETCFSGLAHKESPLTGGLFG